MAIFHYELVCTYNENVIAASIILVVIKIMEQVNVKID